MRLGGVKPVADEEMVIRGSFLVFMNILFYNSCPFPPPITEITSNMKSIAALTVLAGSAATFSPTPITRVESSLNYAAELDSMTGVSAETGNKVVRIYCEISVSRKTDFS